MALKHMLLGGGLMAKEDSYDCLGWKSLKSFMQENG